MKKSSRINSSLQATNKKVIADDRQTNFKINTRVPTVQSNNQNALSRAKSSTTFSQPLNPLRITTFKENTPFHSTAIKRANSSAKTRLSSGFSNSKRLGKDFFLKGQRINLFSGYQNEKFSTQNVSGGIAGFGNEDCLKSIKDCRVVAGEFRLGKGRICSASVEKNRLGLLKGKERNGKRSCKVLTRPTTAIKQGFK